MTLPVDSTVGLPLIPHRVRRISDAVRENDERALRCELRLLAQDARLLASRTPLLPPTPLERRQTVAAERERMKTSA